MKRMEPRIESLPATKLIGMHRRMSLAQNRTVELWQSFMPKRMEIPNRLNSDYISMNVYPEGQKVMLSPTTMFNKWAAVEVSSHDAIPDGMEAYTLKGGKYAVFIHKGPASAFPGTMQFIFAEWLPASGYEIDDREHFEVLPEDYDRNNPGAEEEVWIPLK
ncbi:MAG: GyrI-like domain-containing protein [Methanolobus sp.]